VLFSFQDAIRKEREELLKVH